MASPGDSSHPEQGRAGPGTDGLPSCGGSGLFLSRWAHPGRVFPSNNALFLHPAISAEECAVCVSSRKPKTSIMVSCPAASSSHSFIEVSPGLYLSTDDMLNLEGTGWGGGARAPLGEAGASSPPSRAACGEGKLAFLLSLPHSGLPSSPCARLPGTFSCVRGRSGRPPPLSTGPSRKRPTPLHYARARLTHQSSSGAAGFGCRFKNKTLARPSPVRVPQASSLLVCYDRFLHEVGISLPVAEFAIQIVPL